MDPIINASAETDPRTVVELLASGASDGPALLAPSRASLTYVELRRQVESTVETLNALGIGRNDRVAIVLPNGPEMAAAFLAIAAGATTAPLNPAYTAQDFTFYLQDLGVRLLVVPSNSTSPAIDVARTLGIAVAQLQFDGNAACGTFDLVCDTTMERTESPGYAKADDVALVLHTSGTTSRPKLVPLSQANICASAANVMNALALTAGDRCLNVMPLFHIHGLIAALLGSMRAGAAVFCTPGFSADRFFGWMREAKPTWYTAVPTMHQTILDRTANEAEVLKAAHLRLVRSSSASLPPEVMKALENTFSAPVIEAYGMTEAAHQMTCNPLPPRARKPGSVGIAAGPEVRIMDAAGRLLPPGTAGEVVIRGPNVTAGYVNNAQANAAVFTDGWFRTGDEGMIDEDGYLRLTGRLKEMINRGGEKIMPREIDEVLLSHPSVRQAVAFAVPHPTLGEDLAAAVVLRERGSMEPQDLRLFALERLAAFKVPSQVVFVDDIPKGPTGKLQRIGLADRLAPMLQPDYVAPRNAVEETLVRIWTEVIGAARVGVRDNFFTLGGDSLRAAHVLSRVMAVFRVTLTLDVMFQEPTLAAQALIVEDAVLRDIETGNADDLSRSKRT